MRLLQSLTIRASMALFAALALAAMLSIGAMAALSAVHTEALADRLLADIKVSLYNAAIPTGSPDAKI